MTVREQTLPDSSVLFFKGFYRLGGCIAFNGFLSPFTAYFTKAFTTLAVPLPSLMIL